MDTGSIDKALSRIEAALIRIEGAAARGEAGNAELRTRHESLKRAVNESLARLDRLVEGQNR